MADNTLPETTTAKPPSGVQPDDSFYTWSGFFKILSGQATQEETRNYFQTRDIVREESDCKRCEKYRDELFQRSESHRPSTAAHG